MIPKIDEPPPTTEALRQQILAFIKVLEKIEAPQSEGLNPGLFSAWYDIRAAIIKYVSSCRYTGNVSLRGFDYSMNDSFLKIGIFTQSGITPTMLLASMDALKVVRKVIFDGSLDEEIKFRLALLCRRFYRLLYRNYRGKMKAKSKKEKKAVRRNLKRDLDEVVASPLIGKFHPDLDVFEKHTIKKRDNYFPFKEARTPPKQQVNIVSGKKIRVVHSQRMFASNDNTGVVYKKAKSSSASSSKSKSSGEKSKSPAEKSHRSSSLSSQEKSHGSKRSVHSQRSHQSHSTISERFAEEERRHRRMREITL